MAGWHESRANHGAQLNTAAVRGATAARDSPAHLPCSPLLSSHSILSTPPRSLGRHLSARGERHRGQGQVTRRAPMTS